VSADGFGPDATASKGPRQALGRALAVVFLLFVFLVGVRCLGDGFKMLGKDLLDAFFAATSNPFIALMVGVLATTLVQSSSVSTSMIVGLVAAPENPLPLANAVPMIMGANIGTTVTNTIVSLGHMGRRDEFRRAFAVATCHDFFNFMAVSVLLPMELMTGFLRRAATAIADWVGGAGGVKYESPLKAVLKGTLSPVKKGVSALVESPQTQGVILILIAAALIFTALFLLVKVMRSAVHSKVEVYVTRFLGSNALLAITVGAIVTVMVQSSSVTTSLLVPLAGAGIVTLRQAFPVTLGANVGTTITALLASLAASGANARAGVVIALVHLLFNLAGTLLIYPITAIRNLPLAGAERLAGVAVNSRHWALVYVLILFYGLPALFAFLDRWF
jgi:sodium-dependent phosphate cotransporter